MQLRVLESPPSRPMQWETAPRSIAAVRVLRISLTDRCNFRCLYCMPEKGMQWLPKNQILSFEEIESVVRAAMTVHGIRRFKLTGGEPTVRHGVVDLVTRLRRINGIADLSMTTNGRLLEVLARPLKEAGLDRVTVSIDSLDPARFRRITRTGDLATVLRGIDQAEQAGLENLKINCVTVRGTNDDELVEFARLTIRRRLTVRFIEYMPMGDAALMHQGPVPRMADEELGPNGGCGTQNRGTDAFVSEAEVRSRIERELGPLLPLDRTSESGVGPAQIYRLSHGNPAGRIGFISAMSSPFCSTCNRLRLTANGLLRSCLFEGGEVDIKPILRGTHPGVDRERALAAAMTDCVRHKPIVHGEHGNQQMSRIGG